MRMRVLLAGLLGLLMDPAPPDLATTAAESRGTSSKLSASAVPADRPEARSGTSPDTATAAKLRLLLEANDHLYRDRVRPTRGGSAEDARLLTTRAEALVQAAGEDAGEALAQLLGSLSPLDRTWTVLCWTLSPHTPLRMAVARAAVRPSEQVGLYSALEVLSSDSDSEVRSAARSALAARAAEHAALTRT